MSVEQVLFWAFGTCIVVGAAGVKTARNAVNSAMALVATFFFLAGIYLLLWAPSLAVLQVLVYAGAIMVLFLFVIMLLSLSETESQGGRMTLSRILGGAAAAALLWALESTLLRIAPVARSMATAPSRDFGTHQPLPNPRCDPVLHGHVRRSGSPQRLGGVHVHRIDAQRRQSHLPRIRARPPRHVGPRGGIFRNCRGGSGGRNRSSDHDCRLPQPGHAQHR